MGVQGFYWGAYAVGLRLEVGLFKVIGRILRCMRGQAADV